MQFIFVFQILLIHRRSTFLSFIFNVFHCPVVDFNEIIKSPSSGSSSDTTSLHDTTSRIFFLSQVLFYEKNFLFS